MTRWHLAPTLLASLLAACVDAPPSDTRMLAPSSQHATSDIVVDASATSDGTRTTITLELRDRADGTSLELVDGDQLVVRIGSTVMGMPERRYTDIPRVTRARYELVQELGNPGAIAIELQRPDGSTPRITIPVPPSFTLAEPPPHDLKLYDHAAFSVAPGPGKDRTGTAIFAGAPLAPSGVYINRFGAGSFVVGEAGGALAGPVDTTLELAVIDEGTCDPAFGNGALERPRGIQARTVDVRLWP